MESTSDETLFARWRDGDGAAGTELVGRHFRGVLRFFANKSPDAAEDLVQATFLACLTSKVQTEAVTSFRGFVFGIARIELLRHLEGRGRLRGEYMVSHITGLDPGTTPTQRIAREQSASLLHHSLDQIALDDRIALELYYWRKLSVAEIAHALELSQGGVRAKLHRARQRLRKVYEELSDGAQLSLDEGLPED